MNSYQDDCYFYYYSNCTKGDSCPFRHCEAALGNDIVCKLWQEGQCFNAVCKFRHLEIRKKHKTIPCYWESHPSGCQKTYCAFFHKKPRNVDGLFIPPDKSLSTNEERLSEEPVSSPPSLLRLAANLQLLGAIKTESREPVLSPTHSPGEIRQEKVAQSQSQKDGLSLVAPEITRTIPAKAAKDESEAISIEDVSSDHVKLSKIPLAKKRKRQEGHPLQSATLKKAKQSAEETPGKPQEKPDIVGPNPDTTNVGGVRVKTLEEIRREKAARIDAQQVLSTDNKKGPDVEERSAQTRRLLRIRKLSSRDETCLCSLYVDTRNEAIEKPQEALSATPEISPATRKNIKVKTLEEIMQDKSLRKQGVASSSGQAKASAEAEPPQESPTGGTLRRKIPAKLPRPPSKPSSPGQNSPVSKLISLRSKAASPVSTTTGAGAAVAVSTSVPVGGGSSPQSLGSSHECPYRNTRSSAAGLSAEQARAALRGPAAESRDYDQRKSPRHSPDIKGVRPFAVTSAVQAAPGQRRKGAKQSAVEVKPLNSAPAVPEGPLQDIPHRDRPVLPSLAAEARPSSAGPRSFSTLLESSSGPPWEELQTVLQQSPGQETKVAVSVAASKEACTIAQRHVLKTADERAAAAAASHAAAASAADDFDKLIDDFIKQFVDDVLEVYVDPGVSFEDLLQGLLDLIGGSGGCGLRPAP